MIANVNASGNDYTFGSTVHFTCNHGFRKIAGNEKRVCRADGIWSGSEIRCLSKYDRLVNSLLVRIRLIQQLYWQAT